MKTRDMFPHWAGAHLMAHLTAPRACLDEVPCRCGTLGTTAPCISCRSTPRRISPVPTSGTLALDPATLEQPGGGVVIFSTVGAERILHATLCPFEMATAPLCACALCFRPQRESPELLSQGTANACAHGFELHTHDRWGEAPAFPLSDREHTHGCSGVFLAPPLSWVQAASRAHC